MRVSSTAVVSASIVCLMGCRFGFDVTLSDGAAEPLVCNAGERAVVAGEWSSGALLGDGTAIVGYREPAAGALSIQAVRTNGTLEGSSVRLYAAGDSLRFETTPTGSVLVSFTSSLPNGWDQVLTTSLTSVGFLDGSPQERTPAGRHSTSPAVISRSDKILVAYLREIPSLSRYDLVLDLYDQDWQAQSSATADPALGRPVMLAANKTGYVLLTTSNVLAVDAGGKVTSPLGTGGYDALTLVEDSPPESPLLLRSSGGVLEEIAFDPSGRPVATTTLLSSRSAIGHLHARYASSGVIVVWQEGSQTFIGRSRAGAVTPIPVEVGGVGTMPMGASENEAGFLVFIERDGATAASREIVVAQVCEPR